MIDRLSCGVIHNDRNRASYDSALGYKRLAWCL